MAGIGPAPYAGMLLADMGATVISVERKADHNQNRLPDCNRRGKYSIALNLKTQEGVEALLHLLGNADVLFEGFRPGVMERLGVGPEVCMSRNPRLIYGRMTGWGQTGSLSHAAGHDINYIALTGALHAIGSKGHKPIPPLNLVGDYGGGAMFLVVGILAALIERQSSGVGQIIDAAMTDGSASLMSMFYSLHAMGMWSVDRGANLLDSGAHFYDTYRTKDDKYVAIGAIEPEFYTLLVDKLGLDPDKYSNHYDKTQWPTLKEELTAIFLTKTRDQWCKILEGSDACFAPVLDYMEAPHHPHNLARRTYIDVDGMTQPAPAPRFSRTESEVRFAARAAGEDTLEILKSWGLSDAQIDQLI